MTKLTILRRLTSASELASTGGEPFTIRETTAGWKTEGNPATDGAVRPDRESLIHLIEECAR